MAKGDASVQELVDQIDRGEIRLPEMQRSYVWRATQVRDLFDSPFTGAGHREPSCYGNRMKTCTSKNSQLLSLDRLKDDGNCSSTVSNDSRHSQQSSVVSQSRFEAGRSRSSCSSTWITLTFVSLRRVSEEDLDEESEEDAVIESEDVEEVDASEDEILDKIRELTFIVKIGWISETAKLDNSLRCFFK